MIRIENLSLVVEQFSLREITLNVRPREYFVLLGKPGSGKTLLLECVAGLRRLSGGAIYIGERRVDHLEPAQRGVGYVPQDYALFTGKSVRENIEFGLRVRGVPRAQRERRVRELARALGIEYLLGRRRVHGLSGGERQRVALARALAPRPAILLLDEPLSALDEETRDEVLAELRRIQQQTQTTTLHVCHNLDEMRMVADRVGILSRGRLVQVGAPQEIARNPATVEVARLFRLGTILSGEARPTQGRAIISFGSFSLACAHNCAGPVDVLVRSAAIELVPAEGEQGLPAQVTGLLWREATVQVDLALHGTPLRAELLRERAENLRLERGGVVRVVVPPEALCVFPKEKRTCCVSHDGARESEEQ